MWGNCCLVCVRQPFPPKILTVTPYLMSAHWVLGNVQDTLTIPAHTHTLCQGKLAIGAAMCFSDHCGWHSSETKSVNSNSAVGFFQESCKRNWMRFVCLAANYERSHNNDLTVHVKNIVVAKDFHIGSVSLIFAIFGGIRGSCYYLSKEIEWLVQGEYGSKYQPRAEPSYSDSDFSNYPSDSGIIGSLTN